MKKHHIALAVAGIALFLLPAFQPEIRAGIYNAINIALTCIFIAAFLYWVAIWLYPKFVASPTSAGNSGKKLNKKNVILAAISFVAFICIWIASEALIRRFSLTKEAEADFQASQTAKELVGEPISFGWLASFHIEFQPGGDSADVTIPVHGTRTSGDLHVVGVKAGGIWSITNLELDDRSGASILAIVPEPNPPTAN